MVRGTNDINNVQNMKNEMRYKEANKNNNLRNELRNIKVTQKLPISFVDKPVNRGFNKDHLVKEHNDKLRFNKANSIFEQHNLKHNNL